MKPENLQLHTSYSTEDNINEYTSQSYFPMDNIFVKHGYFAFFEPLCTRVECFLDRVRDSNRSEYTFNNNFDQDKNLFNKHSKRHVIAKKLSRVPPHKSLEGDV